MYDLSNKLMLYHDDYVKLTSEQKNILRDKKEKNITSLFDGLDEYNKNHPRINRPEIIEQGSISMNTAVQNDFDDADIDIALIWKENEIHGKTSKQIKDIVRDAIALTGGNFKEPPVTKTNCVRISYQDGYHIDFAPYMIKNDGSYEHAGAIWDSRNPRSITKWYNRMCNTYGEHFSIVVRLLKKFSKSRPKWRMPGGLLLTCLCAECFCYAQRIDQCFLSTIKQIVNRLDLSLDVKNPTNPSISLMMKQDDYKKMKTLRNRLKENIKHLDALLSINCTESSATFAYEKFFNDSFWKKGITLENSSRSLSLKDSLEYSDTEEFVEDTYDIYSGYSGYYLRIKGYYYFQEGRLHPITNLTNNGRRLIPGTKLQFVVETNAPSSWKICWKVKNEGSEAERRNCIRGQLQHYGEKKIEEPCTFYGNHYVECYLIDGKMVMKTARIEVPIDRN